MRWSKAVLSVSLLLGFCAPLVVAVSPAGADAGYSIITAAPAPSPVAFGSTLQDSASVYASDGLDGTGYVDFYLYGPADPSCSDAAIYSETVPTVVGGVTYSTTTGFVAKAAGTYNWVATFSGDGLSSPSAESCGNTPVVVDQATPTVTSQVNEINLLAQTIGPWTGSEVTGASPSDSATVTGVDGVTPTGGITLGYFDNATCAGSPVDAIPFTLSGGSTPPDWGGFFSFGAGAYSFQVTYLGDSNYVGASDCQPFNVNKATSSLTTSVDDVATGNVWTGTELPGASAEDATDLSPNSNPFPDRLPTGTVTYSLYSNGTCSSAITASQAVDVAVTDGYFPIVYSSVSVPSSAATGALSAGTYSYEAVYSGDSNYLGSVGSCESFSVGQATPTLTSTLSAFAVTLGGSTPANLTDTGTLSGGDDPTGTLTFTLVDSFTNTVVHTETVSVSGDGNYTTPSGYALPDTLSPPVASGYQWNVTYSGDTNNAAVSDINAENEQVLVAAAVPSLSSTPSVTSVTLNGSAVTLKDSASLSNSYDGQGSITFSLVYNGAVVHTESVAVNGNGSYSTPLGYTLPTTGTVTGTYQWNATYPGDVNNNHANDTNNANEQVVVKGRPESTTTSMNIAKGTLLYGAEASQTINGVVTGQKNDGAPEGSVNVTYGPSATPLCSATLVPGTGDSSTYKCALSSNTQLAAANYLTVRATFVPAAVSSTSPNFVYTTSMSGPFSGDNFLVKKDSTTTKVTVSPSSVTSGSESLAIFSVSVKTGNGEVVPNTETVNVKVGSASCVVTLASGQGTCSITNSALGAGSYSVSATYAGDTNLSGSSGSASSFTVKKH